MSASQAGHERQEASQRHKEKCLALLKESITDDDKFGVLLQITCLIRSDELTYEDRLIVLEAAGLDFLLKLINSERKPSHCQTSFYKTAALSILSVWTVEPYIAGQAGMKDFLSVVNELISSKQNIENVPASQEQTYSSCEQIIFNLSKNQLGMKHVLQAGTINFMFQHCLSPRCKNVKFVLSSLAAAAEFTGGCVGGVGSSQVVAVVKLATHKLRQSDIKEKLQYAKILTSFLHWFYLEEVTVQGDWVVQLVQVVDKLLVARFAPDDDETVFDLLCSLVSTTGSEVFSSMITGSHNFLRCVTARLLVEVYMLLDHISLEEEISYRCTKLDRTYKLLTSLIQFVVKHGESIDSESFVVVYRKLVEIGNTIVQFLCSVDKQSIHLPSTHKLVLMTVKALAAILSNVTEEPTPDLLSVLPLLNMLCQNSKQSKVSGVKNSEVNGVRHAGDCVRALSSLSLQSPDFDKPEIQSKSYQQEELAHDDDEDICLSQESLERFIQFQDSMKKMTAKPQSSSTRKISFLRPIRNKQINQFSIQYQSEQRTVMPDQSEQRTVMPDQSEQSTEISDQSEQKTVMPDQSWQRTVMPDQSEQRTVMPDQLEQRTVMSDQSEQKIMMSDQSDQWMPTPDDVLGCLLPGYIFLLEFEPAVDVMLQCGILQTVVTFVDTSLSDLKNNTTSNCPETSSTINGLSMIQSVYTNGPAKVARIKYFHKFFKTSLSLLPCLLSMASPPPPAGAGVCLKLIEATLTAYKFHVIDNKTAGCISLAPHSQDKLFSVVLEYLSSFYEFRQEKKKKTGSQCVCVCIKEKFVDIWCLIVDSWSNCMDVLSSLAGSVQELQAVLKTSPMLPDCLAYLASCCEDTLPRQRQQQQQSAETVDPVTEPRQRQQQQQQSAETVDPVTEPRQRQQQQQSAETVDPVTESLLLLIETVAASSPTLCQLILRHKGHHIARKFGLSKLEFCLLNISKVTGSGI